jgi:hypothetical protein
MLVYKLEEEDPKIKIPMNLRAPIIKPIVEERMEEFCCGGDAIGINVDVIDNDILGGDYSHKTKIMKERNLQ